MYNKRDIVCSHMLIFFRNVYETVIFFQFNWHKINIEISPLSLTSHNRIILLCIYDVID